MLTSLATLTALATSASVVSAASYNLVKEYSGSSFFDDWTYYGNYDNLTNGDVTFVNASVGTATSNPLTYVNSAGNAIMKVDNSTTVDYNYKRNSVRLTSQETYNVGSVWILDAVHTPYGCSVWPAFWSTGAGVTWPEGGEIDTMENVNDASTNQMTLHTESGCSISSSTSFTGTANGTDCTYTANDNSGCGVTDSDTVSYGPEFAAAGGGVFITEFASTGINIWFYARENIPAVISNATSSVDLSSLGTPAAAWSDSSCDIEKYFTAQQLIFDITLCGDWAGTASTLAETCPALSGSATCYTTYVLDASNYDTAYFEVISLRVYGSSSTNSTATSAAGRSTVGGGVLSLSTLAAGGLASVFAWFS